MSVRLWPEGLHVFSPIKTMKYQQMTYQHNNMSTKIVLRELQNEIGGYSTQNKDGHIKRTGSTFLMLYHLWVKNSWGSQSRWQSTLILCLLPLMTMSKLQLNYRTPVTENHLMSSWTEVLQLWTHKRGHLTTVRWHGDTNRQLKIGWKSQLQRSPWRSEWS